MRSRGLACLFAIALVLTASSKTALAIPVLQLYIDGATYDPVEDSWVIATAGPFDLWVIGDVGSYGTISDVKLAAAVDTAELLAGGSVSLAPTTTGVVTDPSTPSSPVATANFPSADGALPVRGDGTTLPPHGVYGAGTSFFEWELGDLTLTDSPIGDFISSFPSSFPSTGQINVYTVTVSGFSQVHFDTYDHIVNGGNHTKYVFAPFSHDAGATVVPEPSSLLLVGPGMLALGVFGNRRLRATRSQRQ
ncbi:MAG: choice-of-anchor N protein [Planctomycetes bacterium]|nr:choice-of-anchor N protein [Planctomycetota bacterium]